MKIMDPRKINPNKLLKSELVALWEELFQGRCEAHDMPYSEHPQCWIRERQEFRIEEKIGYLDIENSNLDAPFGFVLSWCIKEDGGGVTGMHLIPDDFKKELANPLKEKVVVDERILKTLVKEIKKYDRIAVYWGKNRRHDIPYIRHRAIKLGLDFPLYKSVYCTDVWDMGKSLLKMGPYNNSLWSVCNEFDVPAKGTKCPRYYWPKASMGHMDAIKTIYQHNIEDVESLEPLYHMLDPFYRKIKASV